MTTTTTTTTTSTSTLPDTKSADTKKAAIDYEAFLKLLTTQLRNQDPLAPMDATQFMNQLAQLSTVEQAVKTNDTLNQLMDMLKNSGMRMDMAYLGRTVEASSDALALNGGKAETAYTVEGSAAAVSIDVLDSAGRVRYSTTGSPQSGRHVFTWDGRQTDGGTAPDGVYTVRVLAKDKDGNNVNVTTAITDTVKEVRTVDGATQFVLTGGASVPAQNILSAS
ncbi:MAG TPA: flagellar hook assembly protein FlgD [Azospirillum sp.]|nr:flagellar hook assembly protein FlgD [Azospirillum sp.]